MCAPVSLLQLAKEKQKKSKHEGAVERHAGGVTACTVVRGVLDSDLSKRKHVSIPKKMLAGTTLMRRDDRSALAKPTSTADSKVLEVV